MPETGARYLFTDSLNLILRWYCGNSIAREQVDEPNAD